MAKNERTSKKIASKAGKLLADPKTPKKYRGPLASVLSQAPDKKKPHRPKKR